METLRLYDIHVHACAYKSSLPRRINYDVKVDHLVPLAARCYNAQRTNKRDFCVFVNTLQQNFQIFNFYT